MATKWRYIYQTRKEAKVAEDQVMNFKISVTTKEAKVAMSLEFFLECPLPATTQGALAALQNFSKRNYKKLELNQYIATS